MAMNSIFSIGIPAIVELSKTLVSAHQSDKQPETEALKKQIDFLHGLLSSALAEKEDLIKRNSVLEYQLKQSKIGVKYCDDYIQGQSAGGKKGE